MMSRKRHLFDDRQGGRIKPRPQSVFAVGPSKRPILAILAVVTILAGLTALWWFGPGRSRQPGPSIDLAAVDSTVAATIQKHLDEVRHDPRSGSAWGWLGALLWEYDFRPQARECLERAAQLDPSNPRWPYFHGLVLMIMHPAEAIGQFRQAAEICGNDPEAPRFRLARLLAEQGRWEEARREFEPLLRAKPDFIPARLLSARAAQAQGDLAGAIGLARSCTSDPRTARSAWALLAILHRQQGDQSAAVHAAQRSAAAPPDEGFGDPFEAEATLLRSDPRALSEQAHPLLAAGHWDIAAGLIDRLVRQHPQHPDTWLLLGRLQFLRKDPAAAEKSLRHHLELSPQSVQGLFQYGLVLLAQNRLSEAAETFDKATRLKTDYGPAYYNRGLALARAGQAREAIAAFSESLRYNPERPDSYFLLADLCLRTGDKNRALQFLDQVQAINPADPRLRELRGRAAATGP